MPFKSNQFLSNRQMALEIDSKSEILHSEGNRAYELNSLSVLLDRVRRKSLNNEEASLLPKGTPIGKPIRNHCIDRKSKESSPMEKVTKSTCQTTFVSS